MNITYKSKLYQKIERIAHRFFPRTALIIYGDSIEIETNVDDVVVIVTLMKSDINKNLCEIEDVYVRLDMMTIYQFEALEFISNLAQGFALADSIWSSLRKQSFNLEEEE